MKRKQTELSKEERQQQFFAQYKNYSEFEKAHGLSYEAWQWYGTPKEKDYRERMKESKHKRKS